MLIWAGILCALAIWPSQAIEIHLVAAEIEECDEAYIINPFLQINEKEDGNNTATTSFELIQVFDDSCEACMNVFGMSGGTYSLETGLDVCKDLCEVFDDQMVMGPFLGCLGLSKDNCPPPIGVYGHEDYVPDTHNMPTAFPEGDYRVIITINCDDNEIFRVAVDIVAE